MNECTRSSRNGLGSFLLSCIRKTGVMTVLHVDKTFDDQGKKHNGLCGFYERNGYRRLPYWCFQRVVSNDVLFETCYISDNMGDEIVYFL